MSLHRLGMSMFGPALGARRTSAPGDVRRRSGGLRTVPMSLAETPGPGALIGMPRCCSDRSRRVATSSETSFRTAREHQDRAGSVAENAPDDVRAAGIETATPGDGDQVDLLPPGDLDDFPAGIPQRPLKAERRLGRHAAEMAHALKEPFDPG